MLVCQQIIYVAVDLHHRNGGIVNVLDLAYPLVLKLLLQLSVDLREHGLRVVLLSLALVRRCDNHEVDVRPGQAELGGMRPIYPHLTVWQGLLDHGGYVLNQILLQGLHLSENVLNGISELEHLYVQPSDW